MKVSKTFILLVAIILVLTVIFVFISGFYYEFEKHSCNLYLYSIPSDAKIYINEEYYGNTPLMISHLDVDKILPIKVSRENYHIIQREIYTRPLSMTEIILLDRYKNRKDGMLLRWIKGSRKTKGFFMAEHLVKTSQYLKFMESSNASNIEISKWLDYNDGDCPIHFKNGKYGLRKKSDDIPITEVSYYGAIAYTKWVKGFLPDENEFIMAVNMGNSSVLYPWGVMEDIDISYFFKDFNWLESFPKPVKSFPASSSYVYDLIGDCWQWTRSIDADDKVMAKGGIYYIQDGVPDCYERRILDKTTTQFDVGFRYIIYDLP
ncbi:MAG: SUMF1/EgtB/PvdO family nonheme iron enzyme [Candidatus Coatesbacteria bacterium]|nr:SUMF1/EgtB/PvdO family nonheme iron enzyme [Candidatus Coatesbacteria bacterium]